MVMHKVASLAGVLSKRAVEGEDGDKNMATFYLILFSNCIVFLPIFIYVNYTIGQIFPTLAIVEDTNPPAYEPLSVNEESPADPTTVQDGSSKPISSSLRRLNRLLLSVGGWRSNFRGIWANIAYGFAISLATELFTAIPFVPSFVGVIVANLVLVQLSTAWVHIVISPPNPAPFWRRLPPFNKTFRATALPVTIYAAADIVSDEAPEMLARLLNLPGFRPTYPGTISDPGRYARYSIWKALIVLLVSFACLALVYLPAFVNLVRVQASLLPPDEDTILPFDRTYDGTIEPAVVSGKGYVTTKDAIRTFPRASWIRIYILQAKIFGIVLVTLLAFFAIVSAQMWLIAGR
jgi:hypothetical protein